LRQILQNLKTGQTRLADIPCPSVRPGQVLVRTTASVVSVGTERMLVEFGRANLLEKARQQPEKVRQVLDKVRTDGLAPTLEAVSAKLETEIPLGYCNAGVVVEVGAGVPDLRPGDRVVSNGPHAEMVLVPHRLTAPIPDGVTDEQAAWTVLASIALQGVRLLEPTLGECFAVVGLGPIGLLAVQLLQANGCSVIAIDLDSERCARAAALGATPLATGGGADPVAAAEALSGGRGVDGVLLTVSTKSDEPVRQAARMCRQRGRIVLVGVTGLNLDRADFFAKEITFQVSCSYGPGRYDPRYEQDGHDYPLGFVRWTEQRNFEAVLALLRSGRLSVDEFVTHRRSLDQAVDLYADLSTGVLGAIVTYPDEATVPLARLRQRTVTATPAPRTPGRGVLGVLGAGNFASRMLVPLLADEGLELRTVVSSGGVSAAHLARKAGFGRASSDPDDLFGDDDIDAVLVATRHDSHARYTLRAIRSGRAVYVEKPLAITAEGLDELQAAAREASDAGRTPLVMVGFNRRFAPLATRMRELLEGVHEPAAFVVTVNAGIIPADVWVHDPVAGGGRIVGEACHFVDLLRYLVGSPIASWQVATLTGSALAVTEDKATITLAFADGSIGTVHYLGNGSKAFPKERVEAFVAGRVLVLDDFRSLKGYGWPGFRKLSSRKQDKGHAAAIAGFVRAVRAGAPAPMAWDEVLEVSRVSVAVAELARQGGGSGRLESITAGR